jgi:hypothetical protein
MRTFLSEAFKALDLLEEENFDLSKADGFDKFKLFMDDDSDENQITVIDVDADEEEDLKDSYEGKVICDCPVCHSKIFKDLKDIILNDDEDLANVGEECPYCYAVDGFKIIGEVAPFHKEFEAKAEDKDGNEVDVEVSVEDEVEMKESLEEDLEKIKLETEKEVIEVEAHTKDEQIVPIDMEKQEEIEMEQPANDTDLEVEEEAEPELEDEFDVEEFDEESFDELGEAYLKQVYNNIDSFKTTRILEHKDQLIVDGLITFNSGNSKKTSFMFSDYEVGKKNNLRLLGENLNMKTGKKSFRLAGKVNEGKFITEKLFYNYKQNDQNIRGVVKRK